MEGNHALGGVVLDGKYWPCCSNNCTGGCRTTIAISSDAASSLARKEHRLQELEARHKDEVHKLRQVKEELRGVEQEMRGVEEKLREVTAQYLEEPSVKKKLRFLQAYEPGPLGAHFRGDMSFLGRDQERVYAHRFIMEGKSTVFRKMFQNDMQEKESGTVRVDDASSHVIRSMVNFCYTTEIQFSEEASAEEVLKVAHKYDIKDLKDVCDEELCKVICEDNVCRKLVLAHIFDANKLGAASKEYLENNFSKVYPQVVERLSRNSPLDEE
ncbi:hypothetical protein R1sor_000596 [Riccia sorocarpa]|uniref:BTB domain-containing protein n=1 Tax=Riccia sorocarpa TaxID=122646 RepID=A0ABD3GW22_9MARC